MVKQGIYISADTTKAINKLVKLQAQVKILGDESVRTLGELGKWKARSIAPYRSGLVYRNIMLQKKEGLNALVMAKNPINSYPGEPHIRRISNFNLVRWMHTSPKAIRHIHSGDPRFMFTTREYLNKIKGGVARSTFNKLKIR